jgi:hypothetical protein
MIERKHLQRRQREEEWRNAGPFRTRTSHRKVTFNMTGVVQ